MRYFEVRKPRIEIVPMIDIMLFLLVFFVMLTMNMIPTSGLVGHLPSSSTAETLPPARVRVEIHDDGSLWIDQAAFTLEALRQRLREQAAAGKLAVTVAGSAHANLQQLAEVMDACRSSGVMQVGLATRHVP